MQPKNCTPLDFSRRTDALAARLGCDLQGLPTLLGFSRASLFGYRSGKAKITAKAWSRLAQAETDAGIMTPLLQRLTASGESEEESLRKVLDSEDWNDDDEAQLASFLGPEIVGPMILTGWDLLEASLRLFLKEARTAENLPDFLDRQIPDIKSQLEGFRFQLDRFVDLATRQRSDS